MVATDRVRALFADARDLQADALEMLEQAFSATLRRRPGAPPRGRLTPWSWPGPEREPERSSESSTGLRMLESLDPEVRRARLVRRYYTRQGHLQGDCFYAGLCEPIEETERRIRETSDYIDDAERLADRHDQ